MATHSDALLCTPCESSGENKPANQYCLDCDETLCEICADCHMKIKSTKGHKLVSCEEKDEYAGAWMLSKSLMCPRHSDKLIEVRCEEHKEMCCITCATIIHRKCNTVVEVKTLGSGLKSEKETQYLQKRIIDTKACIEEILKRNNSAFKALETSADTIPETLQDIHTSLAKLFEALEKHIMKKVEECRAEVCGITNARKEVWDSRLKDTEDLSKMFDTVLGIGSEPQVYVAVETITAKLEKMKEQIELIDKSDDIKEQVVSLEIKNELKNFLKAEDILSCADLKLSKRPWCHYPNVARLLTENVSANESNITSDLFNDDDFYPGLGEADDKLPGSRIKQNTVKEAKSSAILYPISDDDSDTDSASLYEQNTKYERKKAEKGNKKEKTAKMRNVKSYRHVFR